MTESCLQNQIIFNNISSAIFVIIICFENTCQILWVFWASNMMFVIFLETNCSCSQSAIFKKKDILWTFKFRFLKRIRLMIINKQYKSTDMNHYCKISAFFCEWFSTVHALKEIEKITSRSEKLNNFIIIILFIYDFSNFYFDLSEQLNM